MLIDDRYARAAHAAVAAIPVPPAPLASILQRAAEPESAKPRERRSRTLGLPATIAAAAALALLSMPLVAPGLTQTVEQRIAALLGWTPPPPPPKTLLKGLFAKSAGSVTLGQAQKAASFTIVPPAGLPADVAPTTIAIVPSAVYSKSKHVWTAGPVSVRFSYRRPGGQSFFLIAGPATSEGAPPRYMYNSDRLDARGLPKRFEHFAWRNGDQAMSATAEGINAAEIIAIRTAMHGIPIRPASAPGKGPTVKMLLAPKP